MSFLWRLPDLKNPFTMKKNLLFLLCSLSVFATAQVTITPNWQLCDSLGTLPLTIGTSNGARGMAFGNLGNGERMFVVSRSADTGNKVQIYNAADGVNVGALDMTGVDGGTFTMNDAGMTDDGKLIMGNLGSPLKIYKWDSETGAPVNIITWATTSGRRYGDKITVTGNYSTGTARIYVLPNSTLTNHKLQYFEMEQVNNVWQFKQTPTEMNTVLSIAGYPAIAIRTDDGFYLKAGGGNITQYSNSGTQIGGASQTTVVRIGTSTVRYITSDIDYDYLAYVSYYGTSTSVSARVAANQVEIIKVPKATGLGDAVLVKAGPSLGKNTNGNGAAGLAVKQLPNNVFELYVLNTNNGIAKYTVTGLLTASAVQSTNNDAIKIYLSKSNLTVNGILPSSIELFNTLGQKVTSVTNSNTLNTNKLKGVYVVQVKAEGKTVKNQKISL